jgi:hypothetical protein
MDEFEPIDDIDTDETEFACERLQAKPGLNEETENSINAAWLKKILSGKLFRLETPSTLKANTSTPSLPSRRLSATKVIKSSGVM